MSKINQYLDSTLLKLDATVKDIENLCQDAIKYNFKGVCVYPKFLTQAKNFLKGSNVSLVTVIDFPSGDSAPEEKAKEAILALDNGADELDMVLDVLALKDKNYKKVFDGIKKVVEVAKGKPVKVILETCYLNHDEKVIAAALCKLANASFIKTSTGFAKAGATTDDVILLKQIVGEDLKIKASGGIKTLEEALLMIDAGADRIGTSNAIDFV